MENHVIIAGFGVGGRFIAECLRERGIDYLVVELNPDTCDTQRTLGTAVIEGDISHESILQRAGIDTASVLALAIPDEEAALRATEIAHARRPEIHIIASTRYTSTGLQALQKGADEVIVAEQAVAQEFYRRIDYFMTAKSSSAS
ncbi:MAG: NAD-binding protein [Phycisphaerales bacterium]|nr:NAD-binding protein [Phycisphaerales bacterium]